MDYMCISLTLSHLGAHQLSDTRGNISCLLLLFSFLLFPLLFPSPHTPPLSSFFFLFLFYVYELLPAYVSVHMCSTGGDQKEGVSFSWNQGYRCCEPPSRFWELNPSPLEKQPALLSVESSLLPLVPSSYSKF